ncbi:TlpA disulfide reductase family protein [Kingella negevensis]|uniref:Thiol-disulfide oxidoreductase ResA n=1 Tax=Kingella negevensis TaxID=1522312 RepID=A0A238TBM0_9NEIS|nr:TlpA disulfide reductase family protein [Kingella negevensis]MDK4681310.1 TlpA disulfide reductase family protein [Kingella negevensis]MDK4683507.1 TlpA disulfide reductase family protein [Kingella negevensis]MDK4684048.1 TlpA disulfide reductase family protein [Kingella negevensis]MDK4691358.1 TlpA disulfide reductase family protein [Kingella negevensis]MDK4693493.1 TlpA disulfide reductase family protein [Kingella negevensis]
MKKIFPTLILIAIVALAAFTLLSPSSNPAPAFQLSNLQGKTIDNGSLKNKVTLINFWFPTCPGCVSEMPKLVKMSQDYQGKDFQILGIAEPTPNPADSLDGVKNYVAKQKMTFDVMFDADKSVAKSFLKTELYPTSVLINKRGEVLKVFVGEPDFAKLYEEVNNELAK